MDDSRKHICTKSSNRGHMEKWERQRTWSQRLPLTLMCCVMLGKHSTSLSHSSFVCKGGDISIFTFQGYMSLLPVTTGCEQVCVTHFTNITSPTFQMEHLRFREVK